MSKPLTFKVVLLGDKGVGKTSLFVRLKNDLFTGNKSTLGVDTEEIVFDVKGRAVKIELWDTGGHEQFRTITRTHYQGAKAAAYVYDITSASTLRNLGSAWLKDAQVFAKDHIPFLVGNKADLEDELEIDLERETVEDFQRDNGFVQRFEMSAKSGEGVRSGFQAMAEHLAAKYTQGTDRQTSRSVVLSPLDTVGAPSSDVSSGGCCK